MYSNYKDPISLDKGVGLVVTYTEKKANRHKNMVFNVFVDCDNKNIPK